MPSAIEMKILSLQSSFTASENEISQFVLKNQDFVITNTITTLAKKTGTSEASINRFCKKIGFKGFNSFKIALAQSQFQLERATENSNRDQGNIIESLSFDYRQMILNTSALLNEQDLSMAAEYLGAARRVHIIALYNTSFTAGEFAFKLRQVGIDVQVHTDTLEIQLCIPNINKDDAVVAILPSVLSKDIYPLLTGIKERKAKIILISSVDSVKMTEMIDVKLIAPDKIIARNQLILSNSFMYSFITDILFALLLKNNKALSDKKFNSDTIINSHQSIGTFLYDY